MILRQSTQHLQRWITALAYLVAGLGVVAAGVGVLTAWGHVHGSFVTLRGVAVSIQGGGLYAHDSVSGAAQAIGQDFVTLLVGVPLLLVATRVAATGSVRGQLMRTGALAYFAYTYLLLAFGAAYNELFLIYVALFSASAFAFVLSVVSVDAGRLRDHFSPRFGRRRVGWALIGFGAILALMWLGRIVPSLLAGKAPPGLENYSTLFVQAGDLGIVIPAAIVAGALLVRRRSFGYLLAPVMLVMASAFGLALLAMSASMAVAGVEISLAEVAFFSVLAVGFLVATMHMLSSLRAHAGANLHDVSDNPQAQHPALALARQALVPSQNVVTQQSASRAPTERDELVAGRVHSDVTFYGALPDGSTACVATPDGVR
jgi:hypothetical protein